jgi:hypothetical protein
LPHGLVVFHQEYAQLPVQWDLHPLKSGMERCARQLAGASGTTHTRRQ